MRKQIIIFITSYHPFIGGAEIAIQEIAKRLAETDFFIITARQRRGLPAREVRPEGTVIRLGFGFPFDKLLFPFLSWRYCAKHFNQSPNIILFAVDISHASLGAVLVKRRFPRIPLMFNIQYGESQERLHRGRFGFIRRAFGIILRHADYVTVISTYLRDVAREHGYCGPIEVVPNGVDVNKFQNTKYKIQNTNKTQNTEPKTIITVSRLVYKNGIDTLIEAMAIIKKKIPDIQCWIIGDGPERDKLEVLASPIFGNPPPSPVPGIAFIKSSQTHLCLMKQSRRKQRHLLPAPFGRGRELPSLFSRRGKVRMGDSIVFFGNIPHEEIPDYLAQADLFVRPSRSEGMGNAFVEAMAAGLPVIGTPVGGIPDIIKEGETGLFARPDDPEDLAGKIIRVLSDGALRNRLIKTGRKFVGDRFGWDAIGETYQRIFDGLMRRQKRILIATPLFPPDIGGPATYTKLLVDELPVKGFGIRVAWFGSVRHFPKIIRHAVFLLKVWKQARYADVLYAQDPVSVGFPAYLGAFFRRKPFYLKVVGDYGWEQYQIRVQGLGLRGQGAAGGESVKNAPTISLEEFQNQRFDFVTEVRKKIERFVARRARVVVVPSEYLKKIVLMWGVGQKKIKVIYNSFDPALNLDRGLIFLSHRSPRSESESNSYSIVSKERPRRDLVTGFEAPDIAVSRDQARKKYGLQGRVIVSTGRLVPWKGFDTLIRTVADMSHAMPDIRLVIVGSGPEEQVLKYLAQELGVMNAHVFFTGGLPHGQVLEYFRAADCFILVSGYEGFSHTVLEAMAEGVPVIASDAGGNPEIVKDEVTGFLVPYNDSLALRWAMEHLFALSQQERQAMIQRARETAKSFGKERMIKEIIAVLR